jgi:hypothetical protein
MHGAIPDLDPRSRQDSKFNFLLFGQNGSLAGGGTRLEQARAYTCRRLVER